MTISKIGSKTVLALAATGLFIAAPAFAQSAGTSLTGTSNGMQGTPGQPSPSNTGTPMKGSGSMMKSDGAMMKKGSSSMEQPGTTGAGSNGMTNKN